MAHPLPLEVTLSEFREKLSAYLDAVEEGKTVTITRRGRASAVLSAANHLPEPIDLADLKAFRNSLDVSVETGLIERLRQGERY